MSDRTTPQRAAALEALIRVVAHELGRDADRLVRQTLAASGVESFAEMDAGEASKLLQRLGAKIEAMAKEQTEQI